MKKINLILSFILLNTIVFPAYAVDDGETKFIIQQDVGIKTKNPTATLHLNGTGLFEDGLVTFSNTSPVTFNGLALFKSTLQIPTNAGAGKVLVSDQDGKATWGLPAMIQGGGGDNMGNHTASRNLDMSSHDITNVKNITAASFNGGTFNGTFKGDGSGLTNMQNSVFKILANTILNNGSQASYANNFLIGSANMDDTGNTSHDSRLFFNKSKGAFRVGTAEGNEWDNASVGQNSMAFGKNTIASGVSAISLGQNTTASGPSSVALGSNTLASQNFSTAFGHLSRATAEGATAFGKQTLASGQDSTAFGQEVQATRTNSVAIGKNVRASGDRAFAIGLGNSNQDMLVNSINDSLAVGFVTNQATLFVGPGTGGTTDGKVGVGTNTPQDLLDVDGRLRTKEFRMPTGATNNFVLTSDGVGIGTWKPIGEATSALKANHLVSPNGNIYVVGTDNNGDTFLKRNLRAENIRVNQTLNVDGNLAVGTATPASKFHVSSNLDTRAIIETTSTNPNTAHPGLLLKSPTSSWLLQNQGSSRGGFLLHNQDRNMVSMFVDKDSNYVGIGDNYTPTTKLHVMGTTNSDSRITVESRNTTTDSHAGLLLKSPRSSWLLQNQGSGRDGFVLHNQNRNLVSMFVDKDSNYVGIGDNYTPTTKLHVMGSTDHDSRITVESRNTTAESHAGLLLKSPRSSWLLQNQGTARDGFLLHNQNRNKASLFVDKDSNFVSIGDDTTPTEALDVIGNVKANQFIGDGSRLTNIKAATAYHLLSPDGTKHVVGTSNEGDAYIQRNLHAVGFIGDGSRLTNISPNSHFHNVLRNPSGEERVAADPGDLVRIHKHLVIGDGFGLNSDTGVVVFNNKKKRTAHFRVSGNTDDHLLSVNSQVDNVGIGVSNPLQKLDVGGNIKAHHLYLAGGAKIGYSLAPCDQNNVGTLHYDQRLYICAPKNGTPAWRPLRFLDE